MILCFECFSIPSMNDGLTSKYPNYDIQLKSTEYFHSFHVRNLHNLAKNLVEFNLLG